MGIVTTQCRFCPCRAGRICPMCGAPICAEHFDFMKNICVGCARGKH